MCPRPLVLYALLVAVPSAVSAQESGDVYTRADPEVTDTEVIRWAARELGRAEGREEVERPPVPPDRYLGHGPRVEAEQIEGPDDAIRVLAEIGGGTLGALVAGGVGTLIVWGALESNADPEWMMVAGGSATVLAALGISGGVALAADATGSRGNFGHAFVGQALGAAAAVPFAILAIENDVPAVALVPAAILPIAGAVLAMELAHGLSRSNDGPAPVVAWLAPVEDGVLGGVAGSLR